MKWYTITYVFLKMFIVLSVASGQTTRYVSISGSDYDGASTCTDFSDPCKTIAQALHVSANNDVIQIAAGLYTEMLTIDRSVSLLGAGQGATIIQAASVPFNNPGEAEGRVITIDGSFTVAIAGVTIRHGNAMGSSSQARGGGLYTRGAIVTLDDVTISGNRAGFNGGGMRVENGTVFMTDVNFIDNAGGSVGGLIIAENSSAILKNIVFSGNHSGSRGGGMSIATDGPVIIENAIFIDNYAGNQGGGMSIVDSSPTLINVVFSRNEASCGGGIYNQSSSPSLINVTFSENIARGSGGGLCILVGSPSLENVIIWNNEANNTTGTASASISKNVGATGVPTISHSLIANSGGSGEGWIPEFGLDGGNNIDVDPLFVGSPNLADGTIIPGYLRLKPGSPAIGAGNNVSITTTHDLDGNPRIVGGNVDLGAYEFQGALYSAAQVVWENNVPYAFGETRIEMEFTGIDADSVLYVFVDQYDDVPRDDDLIIEQAMQFSLYRWVITNTGGDFDEAVVTFKNISLLPGIQDPSDIAWFGRTTVGEGEFTELITTIDGDNVSVTVSVLGEFIITPSVPAAPDRVHLLSPEDQATLNIDTVQFMWQRSEPDVDHYRFQIATDTRFTSLVADTVLTDTMLVLHDLGIRQSYRWHVRAENSAGEGPFSEARSLSVIITAIEINSELPIEFMLFQNYPNPFNPTTTIRYSIPGSGFVTLKVYDVLGREVVDLVNEEKQPGVYEVHFNANELTSGVYIYRLTAGDYIQAKQLLLLK